MGKGKVQKGGIKKQREGGWYNRIQWEGERETREGDACVVINWYMGESEACFQENDLKLFKKFVKLFMIQLLYISFARLYFIKHFLFRLIHHF